MACDMPPSHYSRSAILVEFHGLRPKRRPPSEPFAEAYNGAARRFEPFGSPLAGKLSIHVLRRDARPHDIARFERVCALLRSDNDLGLATAQSSSLRP